MDAQRPHDVPPPGPGPLVGPLAGRTLHARYRLRAVLGRGGMGEVYEAEDLRLHRLVAVKLLRDDLAGDRRLLERFRREARTAGSLTHPHIVAVHDVGEDGGLVYLVMELVRGRTLAEVIAEEAPLPPRRAARIAEQVAEALGFAHERGVVHRDVAPGNVMLTSTGEVKILDFGIARADRTSTGSTAPPSVHGTVPYLAPELASGDPSDHRADLYALGAVLSELLTGAPPFGAHRAQIPSAIDPVVLRCLAPDPRLRFSSAGEVAAALRTAVGDTSRTALLPAIPARPDPAPRRPATPVLASAETLPLGPGRGRGRRSGRGRRWAVASATVLAGLATWFVALPVWQAMSDPAAPVSRPAPPALQAPTHLTSTGACDGWWSTRIELAWTPAGTDAASFEIYRADAPPGPYRLVQRVGGTVTRWTDRNLGVGDRFTYLVRAVDGERRGPLTPALEGSTPSFCLG